MKVFAVTYFYSDVPSFGNIICREDEKYFYPKFQNNRLNGFDPISLEEIKNWLEVKVDININENDEQLYAYYCDEKVYIGKKDEIKDEIKNLIENSKIYVAFSLIEAIEFLNEDYYFAKKAIKNAFVRAKEYYSKYPVHIKNFEDITSEYLESVKKNNSRSTNFYNIIINNCKIDYINSDYDYLYKQPISA